MKNTALLVGFLVGMAPVAASYAAPPPATRLGVSVSGANYTVNDPDGDANDTSTGYLSGIVTAPISRNHLAWRWWGEVSYRQFTLDPGVNTIGQKVTSFAVSGVAQHGFNVHEHYRPWIGLGLQAGLNDYKNRHTVDSGGFLDQRYGDRNQTSFNLLLNAGVSSRPLGGGYFVGGNLTYHSPLDDGIEGIQLQMFVLF